MDEEAAPRRRPRSRSVPRIVRQSRRRVDRIQRNRTEHVVLRGGVERSRMATRVAYAWTFGDGGTATGPTPTYTYTAANSYTAVVTVTDGRGGSASASALVYGVVREPSADRADRRIVHGSCRRVDSVRWVGVERSRWRRADICLAARRRAQPHGRVTAVRLHRNGHVHRDAHGDRSTRRLALRNYHGDDHRADSRDEPAAG
ncbi:MAG: PKD domain-containing protein [Vicinamibacterales bacterium]